MSCWGWALAPGMSRPLGTLEPVRRALWAHGFRWDKDGWWTIGWQATVPSRWASVGRVS